MKKSSAVLFVVAMVLAFMFGPVIERFGRAEAATRRVSEVGAILALNGSPTYLGRISATTTAKNNQDATLFNIPSDAKVLAVYCSAACRVLGDTDTTEDITATNGFPVAATTVFVMILKDNQSYLQAITASGTADVDVWRLD